MTSVLTLYNCESCQIPRVPWTVKKTNDWLPEKAGVKRNLVGSVKAKKLRYFGHVMRKSEDCFENEITQGTLPGKRRSD